MYRASAGTDRRQGPIAEYCVEYAPVAGETRAGDGFTDYLSCNRYLKYHPYPQHPQYPQKCAGSTRSTLLYVCDLLHAATRPMARWATTHVIRHACASYDSCRSA